MSHNSPLPLLAILAIFQRDSILPSSGSILLPSSKCSSLSRRFCSASVALHHYALLFCPSRYQGRALFGATYSPSYSLLLRSMRSSLFSAVLVLSACLPAVSFSHCFRCYVLFHPFLVHISLSCITSALHSCRFPSRSSCSDSPPHFYTLSPFKFPFPNPIASMSHIIHVSFTSVLQIPSCRGPVLFLLWTLAFVFGRLYWTHWALSPRYGGIHTALLQVILFPSDPNNQLERAGWIWRLAVSDQVVGSSGSTTYFQLREPISWKACDFRLPKADIQAGNKGRTSWICKTI